MLSRSLSINICWMREWVSFIPTNHLIFLWLLMSLDYLEILLWPGPNVFLKFLYNEKSYFFKDVTKWSFWVYILVSYNVYQGVRLLKPDQLLGYVPLSLLSYYKHLFCSYPLHPLGKRWIKLGEFMGSSVKRKKNTDTHKADKRFLHFLNYLLTKMCWKVWFSDWAVGGGLSAFLALKWAHFPYAVGLLWPL